MKSEQYCTNLEEAFQKHLKESMQEIEHLNRQVKVLETTIEGLRTMNDDLMKENAKLDTYCLTDSATILDQAKRIKYLEMVVSMCHTLDTVEDIPILEAHTAPIANTYSSESGFDAPKEVNLWYGVEHD